MATIQGLTKDGMLAIAAEIGTKVSKNGDTMSGALVLSGDPTLDLHAATKQYVDSKDATIQGMITSNQETARMYVKNGSTALTKGTPVYITGANGTNIIVGAAGNASEATSSKTVGLLETDLDANGVGYVVTAGKCANIDTSGASAAGDAVWLGPSGTKVYGLANKPVAPAHMVYLGVVSKKNASTGEIEVRVQNGFELNELHDVLISSPTGGQALTYDDLSGLWKNTSSSGGTLPVGGSTGQTLVKNSATNYDAVWGTLPVNGGGTGASSLTSGGYLKGAGTSAITSQTGIPAGDITSGSLAMSRGGTGITTGAGLFPIIPTSISNTSGTASFNSTTGLITLSGCGDLMLNGVFTSLYRNYKVIFNASGSGNTNFGAILAIAFCSGGVKNNSNNYTYTNMYTQSGSVGGGAGTSTGTNWIFLGYHKDYTLEIAQPANASTGTTVSFIGTYNHTLMTGQGGYNANAAFDGIQFANNFYTGTIQVYGYN